jgi:hypothetical protein
MTLLVGGSTGIADQARGKRKKRPAEEWRLPVELEIILGLEDIVENPEAAPDAHLAVPLGVPGEAEAGRPVVLVRGIDSARSALVAREEESCGSIGEPRGPKAWDN